MTRSRHALISIVCAAVGAISPLQVSAQNDCDLDQTIVRVVDQIQRSHQDFSYSGTFLKESSVGRNFIEKTYSAGEELGQLDYLNAGETESTQSVWAPRGPAVTACELSEVYALHLER